MKHKTFSIMPAMLISVVACGASAHDFEVNGIYYKIINANLATVAVSYGGSSPDSYSNEYAGNVIIPESVTYNAKTYSVTEIIRSAFSDCSDLTSVTIPNSVTSIGSYAFQDCINLYSVTSLVNIPFKLDASAFIYTNSDYMENTIYMIATLYVPLGRESFYGQTSGWNLFTNIQPTDTKFRLT